MPVRFETRSNYDASYVQAAAIGAATGYLAKKILPLNGQEQKMLNTVKNMPKQVKRPTVESAKNAIKNARPALSYSVFGALVALSVLTIINAIKKISDVHKRKANLDIEA